jgi:carbamoyl-phosphate synthase large subunit
LNVLLSSAGRRIGLLNCFRESLKDLGLDGHVYAVDCSATAPAFHMADRAWLAPRCTETGFTGAVMEIARAGAARLVVPTIDTELPAYAAARQAFADSGLTTCISDEATVAICYDKESTHSFLVSHGFPTVAQASVQQALNDAGGWALPLIAKPRRGSASIGVHLVRSWAEVVALAGEGPEWVLQEIAAGDEYTINVYMDRVGRCRCAVPHRRLEVRAGEVAKAVTVKHAGMMELAREVAEALPGARGPLNIQCFLAADGAMRVIEMNARFGGGYPLAHRAGAHFTRWLVEEELGKPTSASFDGWQDDVAMLRYDEAVFVPGARIREGMQHGAANSG